MLKSPKSILYNRGSQFFISNIEQSWACVLRIFRSFIQIFLSRTNWEFPETLRKSKSVLRSRNYLFSAPDPFRLNLCPWFRLRLPLQSLPYIVWTIGYRLYLTKLSLNDFLLLFITKPSCSKNPPTPLTPPILPPSEPPGTEMDSLHTRWKSRVPPDPQMRDRSEKGRVP